MKLLVTLFATTALYSLTLPEAELRALQVSPAMQLGDLEAQQHNAQYAQALLAWFPDISYGSMVAVLQKSQKISSFQKQKHLFSNQFTLTQPIFSSTLLGNLQLSDLAKKVGKVGKEAAANTTLLAVRTSYLLWGVKSQEADVQQTRLARLQKAYQDQQARLKSGATTQLQVAKAKAEISQEIARQLESRKEATQANQALVLLLGLSPLEERQLTFGGFPPIEKYPLLKEKQTVLQYYLAQSVLNPVPARISLFNEEEIEQWISKAHVHHPQLRKSSLYVQAANAKRSESLNQYFPEVSAFVDYGYYQPVNGQFFRQRNDWAGGIQLSWSLFDSFKREMKAKEMSALCQSANFTLTFESQKLEMTIRQDLHDIEEALFVYENAQENLFLAQQALQEAQIQYETGTVADLQMQDAQQFLTESEYTACQAQSTLLQKYYQLQHDIGKKD